MSMHYIAQREEHAEQAFLATVKLKADGTRVTFSREDHDAMHLLGRADRILPNGWCLLPPLQACGKGNACLTCSVFVTDHTHQQALQRQLADTDRPDRPGPADFQQRHGRPMPDDNVWLAQRQAEHDALTRVLAAMQSRPGRAVQGAGCPSAPPAGPVPVTIDTASHGKTSHERHPRPPHRRPRRRGQGQIRGEGRRRRPGDPPTGQARRARHLPGRPARGRRLPRLPLRKPRPPRPDRAAPRPGPPAAGPARDANSDNTIIQALTSQITHLKKQHRDETQALRAALEQAHGENLQLRRELTRLGWNPQPATT